MEPIENRTKASALSLLGLKSQPEHSLPCPLEVHRGEEFHSPSPHGGAPPQFIGPLLCPPICSQPSPS